MTITSITVGASLTIPHPTVPYANARPTVEVTATVGADEDPVAVRQQLQEWVNKSLLASVAQLQEIVQ